MTTNRQRHARTRGSSWIPRSFSHDDTSQIGTASTPCYERTASMLTAIRRSRTRLLATAAALALSVSVRRHKSGASRLSRTRCDSPELRPLSPGGLSSTSAPLLRSWRGGRTRHGLETPAITPARGPRVGRQRRCWCSRAICPSLIMFKALSKSSSRIVDVAREAELPGEQHCPAARVVEHDGGAVAPVVGLALSGLPAPIAAAVVEGGAPQDMPSVGGDLDITNDHVRVSLEVPSNPIETCAAAVVGAIHSDARGMLAHSSGAM